jgi:hypothetical protein
VALEQIGEAAEAINQIPVALGFSDTIEPPLPVATGKGGSMGYASFGRLVLPESATRLVSCV